MSRLPSIPDKLHPYVANLVSEGLSASQIKAKLEADHQLVTGLTAVTRLAKKIRLERQEAAKAAYAEEVSRTAGHDLRTMDKVITNLERTFMRAVEADDTEKYLKIAAELNKWNARRIELSGISRETLNVNENDQDDEEELREEILKKTSILSGEKTN